MLVRDSFEFDLILLKGLDFLPNIESIYSEITHLFFILHFLLNFYSNRKLNIYKDKRVICLYM